MGPQSARGRRGRASQAKGASLRATELPDSEKLPLLRHYMDKWAWEVKSFMGIDADASDDEIPGSRATPPSSSPSSTDQPLVRRSIETE